MLRSRMLITRGTLLLVTVTTLASSDTAHAQDAWLAVPGWINPDSAIKRKSSGIPGDIFFESGHPVAGLVLGGTEMVGIDLTLRGAFRYHDSRGIAHGRSWRTSLLGVLLATTASALTAGLAPKTARDGNIAKIAEAEARARALASSTRRFLPGLAPDDTVHLRSAPSSAKRGLTITAEVAADEVYFRGDGSIATHADSAQPLLIFFVRRRVRGPHPAPVLVGFAAGIGSAIALCAKRFEACYPYTTVWAGATAGFGVGSLIPTPQMRTFPAGVVPRSPER